MAKQNVEIVRQYFTAWEQGGLDAIAEFWHRDIDWRAIEGAIDDIGIFRGPDAMRHYYEQWLGTFDDLRAEPEELIDTEDQVVAVVHMIGRMKGSEAEVDMRFAVIVTVRDGKIARGREYGSREQALEAAGLSESDAHSPDS